MLAKIDNSIRFAISIENIRNVLKRALVVKCTRRQWHWNHSWLLCVLINL